MRKKEPRGSLTDGKRSRRSRTDTRFEVISVVKDAEARSPRVALVFSS